MARYIMVALMLSLAAATAFSQAAEGPSEGSKEAVAQATPAQAAASAGAPQSKEMAIYGEVQAVNAALSTFSVQYYDYDSDSEKTADITVGKETKMENAKALGDIKKGDWVDVTYTEADAKFTAKMVSVEKEEPSTESASGAAASDMPSEDQ